MAKKLLPEVAHLLAFIEGKLPNGFPSDLHGSAANIAVKQVLQDWQITMSYSSQNSQNLIEDIDVIIEHLLAFRQEAAKTLPAKFGGNKAVSN